MKKLAKKIRTIFSE